MNMDKINDELLVNYDKSAQQSIFGNNLPSRAIPESFGIYGSFNIPRGMPGFGDHNGQTQEQIECSMRLSGMSSLVLH